MDYRGIDVGPGVHPDWMKCYAEKALQCDQILGICAREAEVRKKLYALYAKWVEESDTPNTFAPDEQVDKTARGRTGACAEEMRKILYAEEK